MVRVIGGPKARRKEAVFPRPVLFAFFPLTGNRIGGRATCGRGGSGGAAGLARPGTGFTARTRVKAHSAFNAWNSRIELNWQGRSRRSRSSSGPILLQAPQPAAGPDYKHSWRLLSLANCSSNGHYKMGR